MSITEKFPHLAEQWSPKNEKPITGYTRGSHFKAQWICGRGHEWVAALYSRTSGQGCPFCAGRLPIPGETDLATTHPHLVPQWSPRNAAPIFEVMMGSSKKFWWVCGKGHEWQAPPNSRTGKKSGCPECAGRHLWVRRNIEVNSEAFPELAKEWSSKNLRGFDTYSYGSQKRVWWVCEEGHEWQAQINSRTNGRGCPVCANRKVEAGLNDLRQLRPEIAEMWHPGNDKTPDEVSYGSAYKAMWVCPEDIQHTWKATVGDVAAGRSHCPECGGSVSRRESEVAQHLERLGIKFSTSDRAALRGKEIDILCPDQKVGIEFNGLYWHSEAHKENDYHYQKSRKAEEAGIQLLHIWEDDWRDRREVVERMIARKLGVSTEERVNARSLKKAFVNAKEARKFLDENHIQGFVAGTAYYALKRDDEILALLVMRHRKDNEWELARYATSANVRGGFTRLFKWFQRDRPTAQKVVTFADRGVSDGGLYEATGFKYDGELAPDYMYVVRGKREHKFNYRKARFKRDENLKYEEGLTERELAALNGLERIYDAGKVRWVWIR